MAVGHSVRVLPKSVLTQERLKELKKLKKHERASKKAAIQARNAERLTKKTERARSGYVTIPLKKGTLREFGYKTKESEAQRRAALRRAVEVYGWHTPFFKLHALSVITKKTNPEYSKIYIHDREWVRDTFRGKYPSRTPKADSVGVDEMITALSKIAKMKAKAK